MRSILLMTWNAPAFALARIGVELRGFAFRYRVARVRRLRLAGRDKEADRTLLAVQAGLSARRRADAAHRTAAEQR